MNEVKVINHHHKVVLFGATGLVGAAALKILESDPKVLSILVVGRNQKNISESKKVEFYLSDLNSKDDLKILLKKYSPQVALCCLGTTMAKAKTKEAFFKIDHDLILNVASACYESRVDSFGVVSSLGANPRSKNFYLSVKGKTEEDLKKIGFKNLVILRPSVLLGDRDENRPLDKLANIVAPVVNFVLFGPFQKYRGVTGECVAKKLILETLDQKDSTRIIEWPIN